MKPINDKKEPVTLRAVSGNEEGRKRVEKIEVGTRNVDTLKYVEKKLVDKGVQRLERHPRDGLPLGRLPKEGHGGKYTWEGPEEDEMEPEDQVPVVLDEKDPNYVDDDEAAVAAAEEGDLVVGEVEVAKVAEEGVSRVDVVDPQVNAKTS